MDYFYHYTTVENWEKIRKEGLQLGRSIAGQKKKDTPGFATKPALFGLPSPAPKNWLTCYMDMPDASHPQPILTCLLDSIARHSEDLVLIKVRLLPGDDVRVGDYKSLWEVYNTDLGTNTGALVKYCNSVTKIQDRFNIASVKLPEILCFNPIPAARIELVEIIPAKTPEEISAYVDAKKSKIANAVTAANSRAGLNGSTC
jgi:hypothetical protein